MELADQHPVHVRGWGYRMASLEVEQAVRCLYDARIPIDNGAVERLHVRAALKRKNFLFAGSDAGGRRAAVAYTALGSCRLAGVNPEEYVADVLPRLARRVTEAEADQLLPEFRRRNGPSVTQD